VAGKRDPEALPADSRQVVEEDSDGVEERMHDAAAQSVTGES
jgi:hypothetical protein